jgi:hypothetical protein
MTLWVNATGVGQNSAIPTSYQAGVPDKMAGSIRYFIQMTSPALAGLIFVTVRWVDRGGVPRAHTSTGLSLVGSGRISHEFEVYIEDTGIDGTLLSFETSTVGVLGQFTYDYFFQVEGHPGA